MTRCAARSRASDRIDRLASTRRVGMLIPEERRHLTAGPRLGEVPGGAGAVGVLARGGANAREILERARAVLLVVLEHSEPEWPTVEEWGSLLPSWFVAACGPEMSREEADRW